MAVTIVDVARRARVALSTASDILNGKLKATPQTAGRVRRAAAALGYRPSLLARGLRRARAGAVGLVAPFPRPLFTNALLSELLGGIQAAQREIKVNLVLAAGTYSDPGQYYGQDLVDARAIDGLIVVGTRETYGRDVNADVRSLRERNCPLIWLNHYDGVEAVDRVQRAPGEWAAVLEHLRQRGHQHVGYVAGFGRMTDLKRHLRNLGFDARSEWIVTREVYGGEAFADTLKVLRLPREGRPTALVCSSDELAMVALQAAFARNLRVPQDLAIASLSQQEMAKNAAVPLTTYGPPTTELGRRAMLRLCERIDNPGLPPQEIQIPGELIIGRST